MRVFIDEGRKWDAAPFISVRLNDARFIFRYAKAMAALT